MVPRFFSSFSTSFEWFPPAGHSPVSPVQYSGRSQSPVACLKVFESLYCMAESFWVLVLYGRKFLSPYIVWLKVFESLYCMVESYWVFVLFARKFFGYLYCMDESCLVLVLHVWKFLCPNNVCLKVFEPLYCMPEVVKTAFWIQNDNSMIIICSFSCVINPWGWHAFFKVNDLS